MRDPCKSCCSVNLSSVDRSLRESTHSVHPSVNRVKVNPTWDLDYALPSTARGGLDIRLVPYNCFLSFFSIFNCIFFFSKAFKGNLIDIQKVIWWTNIHLRVSWVLGTILAPRVSTATLFSSAVCMPVWASGNEHTNELF